MPAAISAFCCAAWPADIFKMTPLPNRETLAVRLHFNWSNDLTYKARGFWFEEVSYTERASGVKENFPKFLAWKDKALATILPSVEQRSCYFHSPGVNTLLPYERSWKVRIHGWTWVSKLQWATFFSLRVKGSDSVKKINEGDFLMGCQRLRILFLKTVVSCTYWSAPTSYNVMGAALKANEDVPKKLLLNFCCMTDRNLVDWLW